MQVLTGVQKNCVPICFAPVGGMFCWDHILDPVVRFGLSTIGRMRRHSVALHQTRRSVDLSRRVLLGGPSGGSRYC